MNTNLLSQCVANSFADTMTFGAVVQKLISDKIEWYSSNLMFGVTTHYAADGSHHQTKWPEGSAFPIADAFSPNKVGAALRAIQGREITYPEFLRQIGEAGVVYYTVHLQGRKAIYFGRHGEFYIEMFPPAKPVNANVQIIQELYAAFGRRDFAKIFRVLSPEVEIIQSTELPWGGHFRGHDGARQFFAGLGKNLQSTLAIERYISSGDTVTAIGWTQGTVNATGANFCVAVAHVWKIKDGSVTQAQFLIDHPAMQEAFTASATESYPISACGFRP
jgi:ketosteroid isomerase-like protein